MFSILTLNKISPVIGDNLPADRFAISAEAADPDAVVVRSFNMHEMELGANLKAIARAGAGVNNIPVDDCTARGIVVFNSPGANSNAVAELTICSILMAERNAAAAINWAAGLTDGETPVTKQVEKGKGAFAGHEILGKTLGVIGLGAIGAKVAAKATALGMKVIGTDPFLTPAAAAALPEGMEIADGEADIIARSDVITVHVPLNDATRHKFNDEFISGCRDGVILVNMSRAEIADPDAVKAGIDSGKIACYACDFPTSDLLGYKNTLYTPHLASGTEESEDNCAAMASAELYDYLINGNIVNSVNYPACSLGELTDAKRVCVLHEDADGIAEKLTTAIGAGAVINSASAARKGNGYTLLDVSGDVDIDAIEAIDGVRKVRVIGCKRIAKRF